MKEYEYIVLATDEIFSHMITSVICLENYHRDNLNGVFRNIFAMFNELREAYKNTILLMGNEEEELQRACMKTKCTCKREKILDGFIKEMENTIAAMEMKPDIAHRFLNEGFSGGKKNLIPTIHWEGKGTST